MKTTANLTADRYSFLKNEDIAKLVMDKGWTKVNTISEDQLNNLSSLFKENHKIKDVGMFYSLYSKDIAYRKRIAKGINEILKPSLEEQFQDFKIIYSVFIVKTPGKEQTEFFIHQDPTITDESNHTSIHFWVPLEDITKENGAISLVEKSHRIDAPYRSITTPTFYKGNEALMKKYLKPIFMKKGEALLLDPRTVHNSMANLSNESRVAVLVGVLPEEAPIVTAFYDDQNEKSQLELYKFDENYFVEGVNFFESCMCRPEGGELIAKMDKEITPLSKDNLIQSFEELDVFPVNYFSEETAPECQMFGEPI